MMQHLRPIFFGLALSGFLFVSCGEPDDGGNQGAGGTLFAGGSGGVDTGTGGKGGEGGTNDGGFNTGGAGGQGGSGGAGGSGGDEPTGGSGGTVGTGGTGATGGAGGGAKCDPPCKDPTPHCFASWIGNICTECLTNEHCPTGSKCVHSIDGAACEEE